MSFKVRSPSKINFTTGSFEFQLTQDNIDYLRKNLEEIKNDIEYFIKKPDLSDFSGRMGVWAWLNPTLKKIN